MNIYKVIMTHAAQKGHQEAVREYLVAEDDVKVFEYLKTGYTHWNMFENECEFENGNHILDSIFEHKGDSHREEKWTDLYYGSTMYDWKLFKKNVSLEDIAVLERLEIAKIVTK